MTNQTDKPVGKLTPLTYADKIIGVYRKCTCPEGSSAEGSVKITRKPDGTNVTSLQILRGDTGIGRSGREQAVRGLMSCTPN